METTRSLNAGRSSEETLGTLARRAVAAQLPSRFYAVLQICFPFAIQAWSWGWHRTAGWLTAASLFGLWAIFQQHLEGYFDDGVDVPPRATARGVKILRAVAASTGTVLVLGLTLEAFAQLMAVLFKCPGCSG